jgi:hypothetical protein
MWLKSNKVTQDIHLNLEIFDYQTIYFKNSNIDFKYGYKGIIFYNYNFSQTQYVYIINSILDLRYIVTLEDSYNNPVSVIFNNNVLSTTKILLETNKPVTPSGLVVKNIFITSTNIQESWTSPIIFTSAISAITSGDINYISENFANITILGNKIYTTIGKEYYDGKRDGIGALYFPQPFNYISATPTSGYDFVTPFLQSYTSGSYLSAFFNISSFIYNLDYNNLTHTTTSAGYEYTYSATDIYYPYIIVTSKNNWYELSSNNYETISVLSSATSSIYYVNITSAYDTSGNNLGTSADPFNFSEFYNKVKTGGNGTSGDIYYLYGLRKLQLPLNESTPYIHLETDSTKLFTIDAWNKEENGPWIMTFVDYNFINNGILSFKGSTIKNGIIYNQPYNYRSDLFGGTVIVTHCYDMFILIQGKNSKFSFYPILVPFSIFGQCSLYGNTFYSENGYSDNVNLSDYYIMQ